MKFFLLGIFLALGFAATGEASPERRRGEARTVLVQLFEWPWSSVAEECETVLGPAGIAAVQISPPTEHVLVPGSPWWERYQPVSHRFSSRSGNERDLREMVRRCGKAGVDVYADVVLNHMAGRAEGTGFAGSLFTHYDYPGLFSYHDFHHCNRNGNDDILDFTNLYELQNCELVNLADLDTGSAPVQERLASLLQRLLDVGVSGFRVDASKHMAALDLAGIFARVRGSFYVLHELIVSPGEPVDPAPYLALGDMNVFPYAYKVGQAFLEGDLRSLIDLPQSLGVESERAVVLLENHDLERRPPNEPVLPFVKNRELNRLATIFMLAYPYGYPQLYSGFHFSDYDLGPPLLGNGAVAAPGPACVRPWTCAHRDPAVLAMVGFRNRTDKMFTATDLRFPRPGVVSFGRGALGHVVINAGGSEETLAVPTRLAPGVYKNLVGEGTATVTADGTLHVVLPARSGMVSDPF